MNPNYTMLRLLLIDYDNVKRRYPDSEQMPKGHVCPGYDMKLMQPLAVLRYIFGIKTQWSCQGTHKNRKTSETYILLAPGERFPEDLTNLIIDAGFRIESVYDYDKSGYKGKNRVKLSSCWNSKIESTKLKLLNENLMNVLNSWSKSKIREHLKKMRDPYYNDIVSLYSEAA